MALFVDLVALSNGLHGSVQMDSVALFSWIGWLRHHGILMRIKKAIFSVLTIIFGSLGLMNIVSTDITLPIMFVFMGLTFLTNARDCYDNGAKKDAMIFAGVAIFVYVVTAYNLISRLMPLYQIPLIEDYIKLVFQ